MKNWTIATDPDGNSIYINMALVRIVVPNTEGGGSTLIFDEQHAVEVLEVLDTGVTVSLPEANKAGAWQPAWTVAAGAKRN